MQPWTVKRLQNSKYSNLEQNYSEHFSDTVRIQILSVASDKLRDVNTFSRKVVTGSHLESAEFQKLNGGSYQVRVKQIS